MVIEKEFDTTIFGENEDWCVSYLEGLTFVEESYEGLKFIQEKTDQMIAAKGILSNEFGLCFDYEGDAGPEAQAALRYMRYLGSTGIFHMFEFDECHISLSIS